MENTVYNTNNINRRERLSKTNHCTSGYPNSNISYSKMVAYCGKNNKREAAQNINDINRRERLSKTKHCSSGYPVYQTEGELNETNSNNFYSKMVDIDNIRRVESNTRDRTRAWEEFSLASGYNSCLEEINSKAQEKLNKTSTVVLKEEEIRIRVENSVMAGIREIRENSENNENIDINTPKSDMWKQEQRDHPLTSIPDKFNKISVVMLKKAEKRIEIENSVMEGIREIRENSENKENFGINTHKIDMRRQEQRDNLLTPIQTSGILAREKDDTYQKISPQELNFNNDKQKTRKEKRKNKKKTKSSIMKRSLKIAYCNLQGKTLSEAPEIERLITQNKWDVICATETHQREGQKEINFKGFKTFSKNRDVTDKKGGGITVWVKNELEAYEMHDGTSDQSTEIMLLRLVKAENLQIAITYWKSGTTQTNNSNQDLVELMQQYLNESNQITDKFIFIGDFNAHIHSSDGGVQSIHSTNANGLLLTDFIASNHLKMVNKESSCQGLWTWMRNDQKSVIDYILANNAVSQDVMKVTIDESGKLWNTGSDHSWMELQMNLKRSPASSKPTVKERWNIRPNTDWIKFRAKLAIRLKAWDAEFSKDIDPITKAELGYNALVEDIKSTAEEVIGFRKANRKKTSKTSLQRIIKARNVAAVKWRSANRNQDPTTPQKWQWFNNKSRKLKKARIKMRRKKFKEKLDFINNHGKKHLAWDWIKQNNKRSKESITKLQQDGQEILGYEDIKTAVEKYMADQGKIDIDEQNILVREDIRNDRDLLEENIFAAEVSNEEIDMALRKMKPGKALGPDSIPNEFLTEGGPELQAALMQAALKELFTLFISSEFTPASWCEENVKLMHKGGEKDSLDNYRAITLSSNIGKLFTRILANRLNPVVEKHNLLGEMQNGFRTDRRTSDNLFILTNIMDMAKKENKKLFLAFVDLRKAFDRVWRIGLWAKLAEIGLGGKFLRIVKQLYRIHKRKVNLSGGTTNWIDCEKGVKQGCVLSPILFELFISDIESTLNASNSLKIGTTSIPGLLFADDLVIIAENEKDMAKKLADFGHLMDSKKLEINYSKTVILKRGPNTAKKINWEVYSSLLDKIGIINESNICKYLGVKIQKSYFFREHEKHIRNSLPRKVGLVKAQARNVEYEMWCINALWNQVTKPTLLYASECINYTQLTLNALEKAQNKIGKWILGTTQAAANCGVRAELGWFSMTGQIILRKLIYWDRIINMSENRWPRILLEDMTRKTYNTTWLENVLRYRRNLDISWNYLRKKDGASYIRKAWENWEEQCWKLEKRARNSLNYYPKASLKKRAWYLKQGRMLSILTKFRIGDLPFRQVEQVKKCVLCGDTANNMVQHIFLSCEDMLLERMIREVGFDRAVLYSDIDLETFIFNLTATNVPVLKTIFVYLNGKSRK